MATKSQKIDVAAIAAAAVSRQMTKPIWDKPDKDGKRAATEIPGDKGTIGFLMHVPFTQKGRRVYPEGVIFVDAIWKGKRVEPDPSFSQQDNEIIESLNLLCYKQPVKQERDKVQFR
jgi:hypothetical protein